MFANAIQTYTRNLEALRDFVETVSAFLAEKSKKEISDDPIALIPWALAIRQMTSSAVEISEKQEGQMKSAFGAKFEIEVQEDPEKKEKTATIKIEKSMSERFGKALNALKKSTSRQQLLYENSLISLISTVEQFVALLLHIHYENTPESVGGNEKSLSLDELKKFGSVDDAVKYLVERKVEEVLRGSFEDWTSSLRKRLNISASYLDRHFDNMKEACLRRNLLVHNGGVVNTVYLKGRPDSLGPAPVLGQKISVTEQYLEDNITSFERNFLLLVAEAWKNREPENPERGKILTYLAFEHLLKERWAIAKDLCAFVSGDKKLKESDRLISQINHWQCCKWQGRLDEVKQQIIETDFSAKEPIFRLAKSTLLDDYDEVLSELPTILKSGRLDIDSLNTWPLFRGLRKEKRVEIDAIIEAEQERLESEQKAKNESVDIKKELKKKVSKKKVSKKAATKKKAGKSSSQKQSKNKRPTMH